MVLDTYSTNVQDINVKKEDQSKTGGSVHTKYLNARIVTGARDICRDSSHDMIV